MKKRRQPVVGGVYVDIYGHSCTVLLIEKMRKEKHIAISYINKLGEKTILIFRAYIWSRMKINSNPIDMIDLKEHHFSGNLDESFDHKLRGFRVRVSLDKRKKILISNEAIVLMKKENTQIVNYVEE